MNGTARSYSACMLSVHHFDFIDGFVVSQSESNIQNILVSNPEVGVPSYGLTEKGKMQTREVRMVQSRTSLPQGNCSKTQHELVQDV